MYYRVIIASISLCLLPVVVSASQEFTPLMGENSILKNMSGLSTRDYIDGLFNLAISIAALLVVIKLMYAGVQYMFTDIVTSKENAKKDIQSALLGLLIILASITILTTINPNLVNINIFNLQKYESFLSPIKN